MNWANDIKILLAHQIGSIAALYWEETLKNDKVDQVTATDLGFLISKIFISFILK